MNHLTSSLSMASAVAALLGLSACADDPPANQPNNTYATQSPTTPAPMTQQYGSTMGQNDPPTKSTTSPGAMNNPGAGGTSDSASRDGSGMGGSGTGAMGSTMGQGGAAGTAGAMDMGGPPAQSSAAGAMAGPSDAAALDDAQIAAVVVAINQGEIQAAQLAQSKAKASDVKNFASHMLHAHQSMLAKTQKEFATAQLTPSGSAVTQQMQADVKGQQSTLQSMTGKDFDRTYIDDQVQDHTQALDMIDRMMSHAKLPQLKTCLQDAKTMVESHLRDAKSLQQKLQSP